MGWNTLLLGMVCALGAILTAQYQQGPQFWRQSELSGTQGQHPSHARPNGTKTAALVALEPLSSLQSTIERPLFVESRRPPPVALPSPEQPTGAQAPSTPFTLSLSAIVMDDTQKAAYFTDAASGQFSRVAQGAEVSGWTLKEVRHDAVVLERTGETRELQLRTFKPAPGAEQSAMKTRQTAARHRARVERRARNSSGPSASVQPPQEEAQRPVRRPRRPLQGPRREAVRRTRANSNAQNAHTGQ